MLSLISDEYRALNRQLHEEEGSIYGRGGNSWVGDVSDVREDGESVLDYGCGKGNFKKWAPFPVAEYDPAIPGKDSEPEAADIVVCTDVLEHVEPDRIDKVIGHIYALTKRAAFITIALQPSKQVLADGRNAHLIIESADWWREKLAAYFQFSRFEIGEAQLIVVAQPVRELKDIIAKGAIPDDVRHLQMADCLRRGLPRVQLNTVENGECALICYGPSLHNEIETIKALQARGVHIITCSGAHDWLLERGVVPYAHTDIDGREHKAGLLNAPNAAVKYWMATVCHPAYFDKLAGCDVSVFHIENTDATVAWVKENDPQSWLLTGGVTVGGRALGLLYHIGYRTIHVFGMDCSYGASGRHAGAHTGKEQKRMPIRCGERWFDSSAQMVSAARNIIESLDHMRQHADLTFYGDGLLQHMIHLATGLSGNPDTDERRQREGRSAWIEKYQEYAGVTKAA